jgi:DNA polymerase-3 subunit delta
VDSGRRPALPVRTNPDTFQTALAKGQLPKVCLITGVEPLLIDEAATALRAQARKEGYGDREVHFVERGFDWDALLMDANSLSLFANLRLIELKLRNAPDVTATKNLAKLAAQPPADTVLLVTGELEPKQQKSAGVNEFERQGTVVVAQPVTREDLPAWITRRLQRQGVKLEPDAAQLLADRVEGNLLAAHQAIGKLGLLHPPGELTLEQVTDSVLDVARFDVWALPQAMLTGDRARLLRMLDGLRAEGEALPLVVWAIAEELRTLLRVRALVDAGRPFAVAAREQRIWGPREGLMARAITRLDVRRLARALHRTADVDRVAKGLRAARADSDAWLELTDVALSIAR